MPRRPRRAIRQLAAPLVALLAMTSDANAVFVTLPNPVPLQNESINLLRNSSTVDGDEWKLVVFGFSHCRDICPRSLQTLGLLVGIAASKNIELDGVFVTVDPDRDTDKVLTRYTAPLGEKASYLRLEGEVLDRFKDQFGVEAVFYTKNRGNEFHYQVDHSSTAFLIDPNGKIRVVFDALEDVDAAAQMLREKQDFFE